jgi:hypothetical protein
LWGYKKSSRKFVLKLAQVQLEQNHCHEGF